MIVRTCPPSGEHADEVDLGTLHSIGLPIQVYPLYEAGFRALRQQTYAENHRESAELYANFAEIAAKNPLSWNYGKPADTASTIGTVSKKNRMICSPCMCIVSNAHCNRY